MGVGRVFFPFPVLISATASCSLSDFGPFTSCLFPFSSPCRKRLRCAQTSQTNGVESFFYRFFALGILDFLLLRPTLSSIWIASGSIETPPLSERTVASPPFAFPFDDILFLTLNLSRPYDFRRTDGPEESYVFARSLSKSFSAFPFSFFEEPPEDAAILRSASFTTARCRS